MRYAFPILSNLESSESQVSYRPSDTVKPSFLRKVDQGTRTLILGCNRKYLIHQILYNKDSLFNQRTVILDGMIKKFLGNLRQLTWFFLSFQPNTRGNSDLTDRVVKILYKNRQRTAVSEYIGLLIIELVTFLETEVKNKSAQAGTSIIWKMRSRKYLGERAKLSIVICVEKQQIKN
jgi:hypothetical protein